MRAELDRLRDEGVIVHDFRELPAETLAVPRARALVLTETVGPEAVGVSTSEVLTAARLGASCTNFFKTVLKQAWEKAMLVGLPCILEEKVLLWDNPSNSPPLPGHGCTLTPLELPTLRGSRILSDEQVSNGV